MANTEKKEKAMVAPDYEHWMRDLLASIKSVRRWKNKNIFSVNGFWGNKLNWIRAFILMPFFNFFAELFNRLVRAVDPWKATPENVLEHSWKQLMIVQKMLAIEIYHGNPHRLDYYKLMQYALNHDLAESVVGDIIYQDKLKNKEALDAEKREVFFKIIANGVKEKYVRYFAFLIDKKYHSYSTDEEFWDLSEIVGYCYFMLEEILTGKLSQKEKEKFLWSVYGHLEILSKNADKFASVKEILYNEFALKFGRAGQILHD